MKPTSRCIDIRQEHPLLEKFKERFRNKSQKSSSELDWCFWRYHEGSYYVWDWFNPCIKIITLDQRRERRGREYYGEARK